MAKGDERLVLALLENSSITAAASAAGVSRGTLYKKLENPTFRAMYDRERSIAITTAGTRLACVLGSALDIIRGIATDAGNAPQVRLNACQILLNTAIRLHEQIDIKRQIDELEARLKGVNDYEVKY